jgi:hypothetical protein
MSHRAHLARKPELGIRLHHSCTLLPQQHQAVSQNLCSRLTRIALLARLFNDLGGMGRKAHNASAADAGAAVNNDRMIDLTLHGMNDVDDGRRILWE